MLSSVSKVFTAVTIAKPIEQKQLSFDTTLGALVPDYPLADARDHVTVGHLLTILITGAALTLGSWIALVPAALNAVLLVLRTSLEDRMLTTELPGYREYAMHVPDRLVPGLW